MANTDNFEQKIFSGSVPPTNIVSQFGSLAAGNPNYSSDPDVICDLAAWSNGWEAALMSGKYPALQDMNAALYVISRQLAYFKQSGIPEWKSDITYYSGSIVTDGYGRIYKSLIDNNLNNAFSDFSSWFLYTSPTVTEITTNYTISNSDYILLCNNPDLANVYIPNPTAAMSGRKLIVRLNDVGLVNVSHVVYDDNTFNGTPSIKTVTVGYTGFQKWMHFICDGSRWWALGDSITWY